MTREEMIALANQAGMSNLSLIDIGYLEAFVNLILEKAADMCDARYMGDNNREDMEAKRCAEAIRSMKV